MSKITRVQGNLEAFASNAQSLERTIFASTNQSDDLTDNITSDFLRGWGLIGPNEAPPQQDFNAVGYVATQLHAYLHQIGVAEWHTDQIYVANSLAQKGGSLWISQQEQSGNDPETDDGTNWKRFGDTFASAGGQAFNLSGQETVTADKTLVTADFDKILDVETSGSPITITLPAPQNGWQVFVRHTAGSDDVIIEDSGGTTLVTLSAGQQFLFRQSSGWHSVDLSKNTSSDGVTVGGYLAVQTDLTGSSKPDSSKYIELTAGLTGSGQYNEGKLINESVSGSQPTLDATAEIDDPDSPMDGQVVRLINTEERYLQPGESAGTTAQDHLQNITGTHEAQAPRNIDPVTTGAFNNSTFTGNPARGQDNNTGMDIDFDASLVARTSDHTDVKNLQTTVFMRIK